MEKIDISFRKKTKRWLGLLTFCLMLCMGQMGFAQQCEIAVTISGQDYGDITTWELLDNSNNVVLSGGPFGYDSPFTQTLNYQASDGQFPFTLQIIHGSNPTWCDNHINYLVMVAGITDISGTVSDPCNGGTTNIPLMATSCPSCPAPAGLTADVTATSAALGWTGTGDFDIKWGASGFDVETEGTLEEGFENGGTLSGLDANTTYAFYVRNNCGGDGLSAWAGPFEFMTACESISIFPWTENFEGITAPALPDCWGYIDANNDGDFWKTWTEYGVGSSNAVGLYTDFNSGNNNDYLILPQFTLTGNQRFKFSVRARSSNEPNDYRVVLSTTGNSSSDFINEILPLTVVSNTTHQEIDWIDLSAYSGDVYIAIHIPSGGLDGWYIYFDNFAIEENPSCIEPSALTATNLTYSSADLGWISDGEQFDIKWGAPGFDVETEGNLEEDFENGATLSGLDSNTTYQFYVRQICGAEESAWAGPFSFTTPCAPATTGFSQNFDAGSAGTSANPNLTDCWSFISTGVGYGYVYNFSTPNTAPNHFYMYNSSDNSGDYILVSPPTDNLGNGEYWVKFYAKSGGTNYSLQFGTLSDGTDSSTFTVLENITLTTTYQEYIVALPAGTDDYFGFRHGLGGTYRSVYIDNIVYEEAPSCLPPTALTANPTHNSAVLGWDSAGENFEISWGEGTFNAEEGTIEPFTNGGTLSGLMANTAYQFYVRQNCGGGDLSAWVGPYTFTTLAAPASIPWLEPFAGTTFPTGWANTSSWTVSASTTIVPGAEGSYLYKNIFGSTGDNGAMFSTLRMGLVSAGDILNFNYGLRKYSATTTASGTISIEVSTDNGVTYSPFQTITHSDDVAWTSSEQFDLSAYAGENIRIRITATRTGSTDDYYLGFDNFYVGQPITCEAPSALTATNITTNTADLSWTSEGSTFDISWGTGTFDAEDGTIVSLANGGTLSGLAPQTAYQYYVRQNCGGGDLSAWAGPFGFTTLCAPEVAPTAVQSFSDFTTTAPNPACWSEATGAVTANSTLTGTTSKWAGGNFGNTGSNTSARINLYGTSSDWLMSQQIDLGSTPGAFRVKYDMAVTSYSGTTAQSTLGSHIVRVIVSTDGGATWSVNNTVKTYTGVGSYSNTGQTETVNLSEYSGVVKIAFVATTSSTSPDVYFFIDNFLVEEIPSCLEPTDLTATNITSNSADLSWTSDGDTFDIKWGMSGFDVETEGTLEEGFENGGTLSGLASQTTYQFYVRQNCGGGDLSAWAGPFSFTTLLANDNIEGAIPVECGGTYTGSTATATNDQPNPAIFGVAATLSPNVWYSYTGSGEPELITASLCNSGFDTAILIATGTPGNLTWIAGNEDFCGTNGWRSQVEFASDGTTTYYIMVRGYGATTTGTYELVITCQEACSPATTNDEVADAEIVILGTPLATNNTCATSSPQSYPTCGSQYATYYDTWYTFNSGNSGNINITITPEAETTVVGFAVYSGTEGNLTQVACNILGASTNFNVTPNTNYYVRAYSTSPSAKGNFTLSVSSNCITGEWVGNTSSSWTTASNWCGGVVPDSTTDVVIASGSVNYPVISGDVEVASITVEDGASVTVNGSLTTGDITVANGGNFVVSNGASLMQSAMAVNTGNITVQKNSNPMFRLDYTLWSSPVAGQNLQAFSPETLPTRIYKYDAVNDAYDNAYPETTFLAGQGYLFRAPNNWIINDGVNSAQPYTGAFTGVAHNGEVSVNVVSDAYNGLGNPYPSAIDAEELFDANPSIQTIYFWTNTNTPVDGVYVANNWATWTTTGGTSADGSIIEPNGEIAVGQGFIAHVNGTTSVTFNNDMRIGGAGMFFKPFQTERHRLWLNLNSNELTLNQILIGYVPGATQGVDNQIDGEMFGYGESALYSRIENTEKQFVIQGRSLPFEASDVVPLGFRATTAGEFTISLANFDGLFAEGQNIYLKDNVAQVLHDLKESAYTFISEEGIFDTRFEVVYQTTMSVEAPDLNNNWIVFKHGDQFQILTQGFDMKSVQVFDMLGRTVYTAPAEGTTHTIARIDTTQVLIVKVTTADGEVLTKKVQN